MTETNQPIAALFDFDGVVVDTEPQYSQFWGEQGRRYHPEIPDFAQLIKGTTLVQIFDKYFPGDEEAQGRIREDLVKFEANMDYTYVPGIQDFLSDLRNLGVRLAVVTSSDRTKMASVYKARPELEAQFDRILVAEDFARSKPFPDCYLKGAEVFGTVPSRSFVFEDSFNGLKAGNAAGMTVIGLATTHPEAAIRDLAVTVIRDFRHFAYDDMMRLLP